MADAGEARLLSTLDTLIVEDFSTLDALQDEWNALVERAQTSTVFQTYHMHASWWKACANGARAYVIVVKASGRLVGVAPLMRCGKRLQFIGTRSFDYCDFIVERARPDVLQLLVGKVTDASTSVVYLRDIPGDSPTLRALHALRTRGLFVDTRVLYPAPTRIFNDPASDRELPNKKSLRRHYNYFRKAGTLEFRHTTSPAETAQYLEQFFEQHIERRAATDVPSLFKDERMRNFFRELALTLPQEWLRFSVVLFNGVPIAMHFGFEYGGRYIWYKPAFALDHARHSPGEVLLKYLLEYALERGLREFDFTIGDEAFKSRFANRARENHAVRLYRRWLPYRCGQVVSKARVAVETTPSLARLARKLLSRWRAHSWL